MELLAYKVAKPQKGDARGTLPSCVCDTRAKPLYHKHSLPISAGDNSNMNNLKNLSYGYGVGTENKNNIVINKEEALQWFYRVFYRNIGVDDSVQAQKKVNQYLVMKCFVQFDRISIADENDNWLIEKEYIITHNGQSYLISLAEDVKRISTGEWLKASSIGLTESKRREYLIQFITDEINLFLQSYSNNGVNVTINISADESDKLLNSINGINFIVFVNCMPLPALNHFDPKEKLNVFSIGGSELYRN